MPLPAAPPSYKSALIPPNPPDTPRRPGLLTQRPQDYRSWLQWGVFESRQRNWDAAERCFQRGTAVAPSSPLMWCVLVRDKEREGRRGA